MKYLLTENDKIHGFFVINSFETAQELEEAYKARQLKYPLDAQNLSKHQVVIQSVEAKFVDGNGIVEIEADIDGEKQYATFTVQLGETGEYEPQRGCWITTNGGEDMSFQECETMIYHCCNIPDLAERSAKIANHETFDFHNTKFNCLVNNSSLKAKVHKTTGETTLVLVNESRSSRHDYHSGQEERETFESLNHAMEFLAQFRTEDHHDFRGLNAYLNYNSN
jgi:hypothetical protein